MNTPGPGLSLFQGSESIKLDTSINRLEEEEALEDHRRRNEELQEELQNAFDDLVDDEDNTIDTTSNFPSNITNGHHDPSKNNEGDVLAGIPRNGKDRFLENNPDYHHKLSAAFEQIERMNIELESKNRELDSVKKIAQDERKSNDELKKRIALSEAERERSNMLKNQTHELLVEAKAKCSELDDTICKLKAKTKSLEANNNDLVAQLERTQNLLADAQHKYHLVEKNVNIANDRNSELWKKQLEDRHRGQVDMLQQQIDNLRTKLEDKDVELRNLDTRYKELQRNRETLMIDKAATINQLAQSLEESQKQCQQLMARQDCSQENMRLQRLVVELERQIDGMQKTIDSLRERLDSTTAELELMDSVLHENDDSPRRLSVTKGNFVGSTPLTTTDRLTRLKDELYRCMAGQKQKREEIKKLQDQLTGRSEEIKRLKDEENKALVQITMLKEANIRLENRVRVLEEELGESESLESLKKDYEKLKRSHELLKSEMEALKLKESLNDESERRKFDSQMKNLNIDLEELKQEYDSLKANYDNILRENEFLKQRRTEDNSRLELEKQKFLLKDAQSECQRLKNLYVEISNAKEAIALELAQLKSCDVRKELGELKERVAGLEGALQLSEIKCSELKKILEKEKISHEVEIERWKGKLEKEKVDSFKASKNNSDSCSKCIQQMSEITKFEIQSLKLSNQCDDYLKQIESLQLELTEAKDIISELNNKIGLKDERDKLIGELKQKAEQFEEYIKTQSSSGVSSPKQIESRDQSVGTSPELLDSQTKANTKQIEAKIRNEMAKIFANELRNIQQRMGVQLAALEEVNLSLRKDLQKINAELQLRQNEVQLLKQAILSEREKMDELFQQKDAETETVVQKQTIMLHKCRDELKVKQEKIAQLIKELDERNAQIVAERQSMKAVMTQWEDQRHLIERKEEDWKKIVSELNAEHEKRIEAWRTKYNSAKKTAANYKRYSEDKEAHMLKEYDRLKKEYDASIAKIEQTMFDTLNRRKKESAITGIEKLPHENNKDVLCD